MAIVHTESMDAAQSSGGDGGHYGIQLVGQLTARGKPRGLESYIRKSHIQRVATRMVPPQAGGDRRESGNHLSLSAFSKVGGVGMTGMSGMSGIGAVGTPINASGSISEHSDVSSSVPTPVSGAPKSNVHDNKAIAKQLLRLPTSLMISKLDEIRFSYRCIRHLHELPSDKANSLSFSLLPTNANGKLYIRLGSYLNGQVNDYTIELGHQIKFFIGRELRGVKDSGLYSKKSRLNLTDRASYNDRSNMFFSSSGTFNTQITDLDDHKGGSSGGGGGGGYSSDSGGKGGKGGPIDVVVSGSNSGDEKKDSSSGGSGDDKYQGIIRMGTSILNEKEEKWFHLCWRDNILTINEGTARDSEEKNQLIHQSIISETIHWVGFAYGM